LRFAASLRSLAETWSIPQQRGRRLGKTASKPADARAPADFQPSGQDQPASLSLGLSAPLSAAFGFTTFFWPLSSLASAFASALPAPAAFSNPPASSSSKTCSAICIGTAPRIARPFTKKLGVPETPFLAHRALSS